MRLCGKILYSLADHRWITLDEFSRKLSQYFTKNLSMSITFKFHQNRTTITGIYRPTYIFFIKSRSFHLRIRNISDKIIKKKITPHFSYSIIFSPKIVPFMRLCGKILYNLADHRWQYNTAHAHSMLDPKPQTHTHNI